MPAVAEGYLGGAELYEVFALAIGDGEYREAARASEQSLAITADEGMERFVTVVLDCAGIAFARLGFRDEAGVCVRLSTRFRIGLTHPRAPMERDALRAHVHGGYFGEGVRRWERRWRSDDPSVTGHRVAARLRRVSSEP